MKLIANQNEIEKNENWKWHIRNLCLPTDSFIFDLEIWGLKSTLNMAANIVVMEDK
jgi:hypothetical protein